MSQSGHPMSDGRSTERQSKERRIHRGEPFNQDDLEMDTSRYTKPYKVQTSTAAQLSAEPEVLDTKTTQQGRHEEGGEARYE